MLPRIWWMVLLIIGLSFPAFAGEFRVLCYHDIQDAVDDPDGMAVSTDHLIAQFSWLREHGYTVVGVKDLIAARDGLRPLPDKAILLTFDDGYQSFYTRVFPLLKAFDYPAVLALVGSWLSADEGQMVAYGDREVPRQRFLNWDQLREVANSGLVEIASHSFNLHHGETGNPQGNQEPALTTFVYDPVARSYETQEAYLERIRLDLTANSDLLKRKLGILPRVMVWPYGRYNRLAMAVAKEAGMPVAFTLDAGTGDSGDLTAIPRTVITQDPNLADFVWQLRHPDIHEAQRVVHVDLDYVYDPDPAQQEANLGRLLDRIKALRVNVVFLQAFADPDADGVADMLYFPNRHLPMRADLFNRVSWQLKTRTSVRVYAWMPVLAFDLGREDLLIQSLPPQDVRDLETPWPYRRLSPFAPEVRRLVGEIYEDLGRHADFEGILFHDDAALTDFEDASPYGQQWLRQFDDLPNDLSAIRRSPETLGRWTRYKSRALVDFTRELSERVRTYRPAVKTAGNIYAQAVLDPEAQEWLAQSLPLFLDSYDFTAIMAMPYMENVPEPEQWLRTLVAKVASQPRGLARSIFELQSVDWRRGGIPIDSDTLARQMRLLQSLGAPNFGYYPDDFVSNHPVAQKIHEAISLQTYPFRP